MNKILPFLLLTLAFQSCKKGEKKAPDHILKPCEFNNGTGTFTFTSDYYNSEKTYNANRCDMFISYRTSKLHPAMWKTHLRMQEGDIGFALDLPRKFTKAANDPADTIFLTMDQLRYNAGIDDGDMYQYASSSDAGSYFVPTVVTDSTVSGNFFVHMSRKRTYSNGSNMDNDDSSILKGTFTNVKILRESL